jgi:hypothetical protein
MLRPSVLGAFCLAIGACSFPASSGNAVVDATAPDAGGVDAGPGNDAAAARCKFTFVDVCGLTPGPAFAYTTTLVAPIDTSLPGSCPHLVPQGNGKPELCVRYATSIAIAEGVVIRAIGARPLVLVASTAITVAGRLDVSSTRQRLGSVPVAESVGAGGEGDTCPANLRSPKSDFGGGGGAAGASFSGKGGDGGTGDDNNSGTTPDGKGEGGQASAPMPVSGITTVRGGCRGQVGGGFDNNPQGEPPGAGGPPGGAIYLAAALQITIESNGGISANGGGGMGGGSQSGGSGGGSGGLIILEATEIHRLGKLTANGGGGGEGGVYFVNIARVTGAPGEDGMFDATPAPGGDSDEENVEGNGGAGAAIATRDGAPGTKSNEGGAGGGGASGFILLLGAVDGAGLISPPAN